MNLIYVNTRWGKIRINEDDLKDQRKILVPIYDRKGVRIIDHRTYTAKKDAGRAFLHKDNIIQEQKG